VGGGGRRGEGGKGADSGARGLVGRSTRVRPNMIYEIAMGKWLTGEHLGDIDHNQPEKKKQNIRKEEARGHKRRGGRGRGRMSRSRENLTVRRGDLY
jgi:hypothetical protein